MNPATSVDVGKRIRLGRLIDSRTNSCMICALDHGLTSPTFLDGLFQSRDRAREVIAGGANVLMLSRGMAKQVVEASGGKIGFESRENEGSVFWFALPLSGSQAKGGEVRLTG